MSARAVELHIGGQSYRVVSSADAAELERLATIVDEKLSAIAQPGRPLTPQTMLLVALSLAHDVEEARKRAERIEGRSRAALRELVREVDATLELADQKLILTGVQSET